MKIQRKQKGGEYDRSLYQSRIYRIWNNIKSRCTNKNSIDYEKVYGGRGIKFTSDWNHFPGFLKDMHESYLDHVKEFGEKNTTIDRIDNNGNYCKENCRWATLKEQQQNTRKNRFFEYGGKKLILSDWADLFGMKRSTFAQRYYAYGWSISRILSTI